MKKQFDICGEDLDFIIASDTVVTIHFTDTILHVDRGVYEKLTGDFEEEEEDDE